MRIEPGYRIQHALRMAAGGFQEALRNQCPAGADHRQNMGLVAGAFQQFDSGQANLGMEILCEGVAEEKDRGEMGRG